MLIPVLLAGGCKSGGQRAPSTIDEGEALGIADRITSMKQVYHLCPSPAEMLSVIDMADMSFDGGLLNPVENSDKYLDTRATTLALGIYLTDLAYSALFGRHEETLNYLEVVRNLSGQIRLTGAIDEDLIQKARNNVQYLDSLFNISNEAFINMLFFCERNNRPNTMVMLSAGAFVESLYLAVNLAGDYGEGEYILQHIAEQKYAIENLMVFAGSLSEEDENIASVIEDLQSLNEIYEGIGTGGGEVSVRTEEGSAEDEPRKLVIGGGDSPPPTLSPAEFDTLKKEVIRLRTSMIEG